MSVSVTERTINTTESKRWYWCYRALCYMCVFQNTRTLNKCARAILWQTLLYGNESFYPHTMHLR